METTTELRQSFLEAFVRELIKQAPSKHKYVKEPIAQAFDSDELLNQKIKDILSSQLTPTSSREITPIQFSKPKPLPVAPPRSEVLDKKPITKLMELPAASSPRIVPLEQMPIVQPKLPVTPPQITAAHISLSKLTGFLADPRVQSIECPGPNKNVLLNVDGTIQTTATILTKEDIESLMKDVSEKTRIPLMGEVFKAALNNFIITAVMSDFVGTRFVIQKRNPFQPLM